MSKIPLFTALETLVTYLHLKRMNEYDQPGRAVVEERGATFGKVTGIEEVIAEHAVIVGQLKIVSEKLFNSEIIDDRNNRECTKIDVGCVVKVVSIRYGEEIYSIEVDANNAYRISAQSPMGKNLINKQIGSQFSLRGTNFKIIDVWSAYAEGEFINRVVAIRDKIISLSKEALKKETSVNSFSKKDAEIKRKLNICHLLDQISMLEVIEKIYDLDNTISESLKELKITLEQEEHFPMDEITKTSEFIYLAQKLNLKI